MTEYIDVLNNPYLSQQQKIDEINRIGEAERTAIDIENQKAQNRIKRGSALQVASGLPILNIPYVGTGIGGGLYEAGNAIMEGKDAQGIWDDAKRGFIIGESVGAIPYVGKYAGKTKVGKAVGNKASSLFSKLMETNAGQKLGDFAKKAEDVLMTDIKAFNPNKQTGYHGSPYDFNKFSNETIGTGEGAQAHGRGHYTALDKKVADERYRKRLSSGDYEIAGQKLDDPFQEATLRDVMSKGKSNVMAKYEKDLLESKKIIDNFESNYTQNELFKNDDLYLPYSNAQDTYRNTLERYDFIKNIDENSITKNEGQLYKLSIPKDDVMLREDLPLNEQPQKVREAIYEYYKSKPDSYILPKDINSLGYNNGKNFYKDVIYQIEKENSLAYRMANNLGDPVQNLNASQEANNLLNQYGVKGISYNGGIDGEARVIFNPDDIDIVRKYYNQPELWQTLKGLKPNEGAELMAIENVLRSPQFPMNETDFKNYENLGLNYYQHIFQPNSVEIPGYGTVTFGRKNRGKDDITNFRMYPDLFELLQGSKKVNRTNYKNEIDREYDYLENPNNKLYQFLIEDIAEKGKRYKMMQNKETGK